jgi:K+-transporting ATPase ATPase A chain
MLLGRFVPLLAALAVGGAMVKKKIAPAGPGTFRTDSPVFVVLLIGVVVLVAALTFLPAYALGPLTEGLTDQLF